MSRAGSDPPPERERLGDGPGFDLPPGPGRGDDCQRARDACLGSIEAEFGTVAVEGEISSFNWVQRSRHMYWTLKDAASQVECAMFRSDNQRRFRVVDGERVVVIGRPTIYRVRGRFQIVVSDVLPQGRGALWLRFEELGRKLGAEGLFAEERNARYRTGRARWPSSRRRKGPH